MDNPENTEVEEKWKGKEKEQEVEELKEEKESEGEKGDKEIKYVNFGDYFCVEPGIVSTGVMYLKSIRSPPTLSSISSPCPCQYHSTYRYSNRGSSQQLPMALLKPNLSNEGFVSDLVC